MLAHNPLRSEHQAIRFCATNIDIPNFFFPKIKVDDLKYLVKLVECEEVKASLFNIEGLKSPRINGFPTCFYENKWQQYGEDICSGVQGSINIGAYSTKLKSLWDECDALCLFQLVLAVLLRKWCSFS